MIESIRFRPSTHKREAISTLRALFENLRFWCSKTTFTCRRTPHLFPLETVTNDFRNSILLTCHYQDLGSASDWLKQISLVTRPIRRTTQIWVATPHQYGISAVILRGNQWWHREMSACFLWLEKITSSFWPELRSCVLLLS